MSIGFTAEQGSMSVEVISVLSIVTNAALSACYSIGQSCDRFITCASDGL